MGKARAVVIGAFVTAGLLAGCGSGGSTDPDPAPSAQPDTSAAAPEVATGFATAADGTRIAYRDWGGEGQPLVLLSGLGDTAAVYDDLAARLVGDHRVVGITRRGFGESGKPADGYDFATRIADDLAVLDELDIEQAVFVGHSVAGDELVGLAADHPDRTEGVVFLDAATPKPTASSDTPQCIEDAGLWIPGWVVGPADPVQSGIEQAERVFGFDLPEVFANEVEASYDFEGGTERYTGSPGAIASIERYRAANPPDYGSVAVPALSLAALSDTLQTSFPWMTEERIPEQDRMAAQDCTDDVVVPTQQANFDAVAAANPAIEAQQWQQTHHYLFLQQPDRTVAALREWLAQQ